MPNCFLTHHLLQQLTSKYLEVIMYWSNLYRVNARKSDKAAFPTEDIDRRHNTHSILIT